MPKYNKGDLGVIKKDFRGKILVSSDKGKAFLHCKYTKCQNKNDNITKLGSKGCKLWALLYKFVG